MTATRSIPDGVSHAKAALMVYFKVSVPSVAKRVETNAKMAC